MNFAKTEKDAEDYIKNLFQTHANPPFPYHNQTHTLQVVTHAREIGRYYNLDETDLFIITIASWFHDIGHLFGPWEIHEENGVTIMTKYFANSSIPPHIISAIAGCIRATKFPSHPDTFNEKIICDADTYHFGTTYFRETDSAVKQEAELRMGTPFPEWHKKAIKFLQMHRFFTQYCQRLLDAGKQCNIEWLGSLQD